MEFFWTVALISLVYSVDQTSGSCEGSLTLENGFYYNTPRNFVIFRCNHGYTLQGKSFQSCDQNGRLREEKPFCASRGCEKPKDPENGRVLDDSLKAEIVCLDGFVVIGSRTAFCDGEKWSTQLGSCQRSNRTADHSCDFESEDQCGWESEEPIWVPWKRISAATDFHDIRTGPRYDHTFSNNSGGHYMLMESRIEAYGSYHFISPIYPRSLCVQKACCFQFHYFMFGAGVDRLVVSVKPVSMRIADMWHRFRTNCSKFEMAGSQGTHWLEHTITIGEVQEDFQVIFTATDANSQFGDIAIDDVKLMTGRDCEVSGYSATTEPSISPISSSEDPLVFDMMSCTGRCGSISPGSPLFSDEGIIMGCGCDDKCLLNDNCCPNYFEKCVKGLDIESDDYLSSLMTPKPTTTARRITTISSKTTKKSKATTSKTTTFITTAQTTNARKLFTNYETSTEKTTKTIYKTTTTESSTAISKNITESATNNRSTKGNSQGHMEMKKGIPNPALIVIYLLVGVVLLIVMAKFTHRLFSTSRPIHERVVSFKKAFKRLSKPGRSAQNWNSMEQQLCDTSNEDLDYEDI